MRLGLFENFYPAKDRLGTHSTSLALLLQRADPTLDLELVVPSGSTWPAAFPAGRVRFRPSWSHGDPGSLLRAASGLGRRFGPDDRVLFNWFPTCFGENRSANAIGMLLPAVVRVGARHPPYVYAHNFIETQDVGRLGYRPSALERIALGTFERALARAARVVVPLESQRRAVEALFGGDVIARPLPFVEAIYGHWVHHLPESSSRPGLPENQIPPKRGYRILLFGVWGPAKDLGSVLPVLERLYHDGQKFETVFAGSFNRFFPTWRTELPGALARLPRESCTFVANPPDELTPELFGTSDLVILPYHAIAGPSGVMALAAFHGCTILAYDVPELREYDAILEGQATFTPPRDPARLYEAVRRALEGKLPRSTESAESKVTRAVAAARRLWESIRSDGAPTAG